VKWERALRFTSDMVPVSSTKNALPVFSNSKTADGSFVRPVGMLSTRVFVARSKTSRFPAPHVSGKYALVLSVLTFTPIFPLVKLSADRKTSCTASSWLNPPLVGQFAPLDDTTARELSALNATSSW
jgi:hypothetical protein